MSKPTAIQYASAASRPLRSHSGGGIAPAHRVDEVEDQAEADERDAEHDRGLHERADVLHRTQPQRRQPALRAEDAPVEESEDASRTRRTPSG